MRLCLFFVFMFLFLNTFDPLALLHHLHSSLSEIKMSCAFSLSYFGSLETLGSPGEFKGLVGV